MKAQVVTFLLLCYFLEPTFLKACEGNLLKIQFKEALAEIEVEIADSYLKRKNGLMFRESLNRNSGMLFVYERPGKVEFWMKNTLIPLDIAFANREGEIMYVNRNAQPLSQKIIHGGTNIQYVLEVNAGMSKELNLYKGARLNHPKINYYNGKPC